MDNNWFNFYLFTFWFKKITRYNKKYRQSNW